MFFANMKIGVCIREYIVKKFHRKVRTMIWKKFFQEKIQGIHA